MKIRGDFVTNSSSSSFIVHFKNKEEKENGYNYMNKKYSQFLADLVFGDIEEKKVTYTEALNYLKDNIEYEVEREVFYLNPRYNNKGREWYNSPECKKIINEKVKKRIDRFKEEVNHRGSFAIVNYCDHSEMGCSLEHEIMPSLPFVIESFNQH